MMPINNEYYINYLKSMIAENLKENKNLNILLKTFEENKKKKTY